MSMAMPGSPNKAPSLSEISHLFLSSLRDRATGGATPPKRIPPKSSAASVDLTPEEFGRVLQPPAGDAPPVPPVRLLLAAHFGGKRHEAARRYAASLAATGKRVGLILIDAGEFRVIAFEPDLEQPAEAAPTDAFDGRAIRQALTELNCDLDLWLLATGNPRLPEARNLMRLASHWILLTACDHESIVAAYRCLKSVEDIGRPRLSIAAVGASSESDALAAFRRLAAVAGQFLRWPAEAEPWAGPVEEPAGCDVIRVAASTDKAQLASSAHWQIIEELLEQARLAPAEACAGRVPQPAPEMEEPAVNQNLDRPDHTEHCGPAVMDAAPQAATQTVATGPRLVASAAPGAVPLDEIIDLPDISAGSEAILDAVMGAARGELVECPIRPPACPSARLAVTRDRRLMVLAVARQGLEDLRAIGLALKWVQENRQLLAMALPQFSLDGGLAPTLRLLVDQADSDAAVLQPLFAISTVKVRTYRRLRWGEKTGLLLDAA
jgi:hypothetical protein